MGRSKKERSSRTKRLRDAAKERDSKREYRATHLGVQERENAARQQLHLDPDVRQREIARRQVLHEIERLNPVVRECENAARQELHLDPVVQERENAARQELHLDPDVRQRENARREELRFLADVRERENARRQELHLDPDVRKRENAARQELHLDPDVRQREIARRQELHEIERLNPDVRERENADRQRRHQEENSEIGRGAITDIHMSMEEFVDRIRNDKDGECFSLSDKNINNALALFYANMGYHRFGQHLKFDNPPASLEEVTKHIMPDLEDAILTSKDAKEIEEEFNRRHSYYPTDLPACGACGRRHNMPDDAKLEYSTVKLNETFMDLLIYSDTALEAFQMKQQNSTVRIPVNDSFETKEIRTTDIISCYEMTPTKIYHLHPELVDGEGESTSTKLCPMCSKALKNNKLPMNSIASGVDLGISERIKELTKPNAAEQSIIARYRIFNEVVKIKPNVGCRAGNYTHYMIQGHSVIFSHDASERYMEAAIDLIDQDRLQSSLSILFVGPKGEMDWLIAKTKGSCTVLGRAFVIIQWLLLLQQTNQHYFNIPELISDPSKWQEMDVLMHRANDFIIETAEQVTREVDIMAEDGLGADIAETSRVSLEHRTTEPEDVPLVEDELTPFVVEDCSEEELKELVERRTDGNIAAERDGNDNASFSEVDTAEGNEHLAFVAVESETELEAETPALVQRGTPDGDGDDDASFPLRYSLVTNRDITQDYDACRKVQLNALAKEFLPLATDRAEQR
jgi:hypothetical protein